MNCIKINCVLPHFLAEDDVSRSEVWGSEVCLRKAEYHLISATSGAGKSSLLSYIFGERNDYAGSITYDEQKIESVTSKEWTKVRQTNIAFVFQGLRLFSELTAFENICIKNRLTDHKSDKEIMYMLECAGLAEKRDEKAARLSFGQQQRVAIIRALCQPFDFLLMDEPFSHLDDENIEKMTEMVTKELASQQAGMALCSLGNEYPFVYHRKWRL